MPLPQLASSSEQKAVGLLDTEPQAVFCTRAIGSTLLLQRDPTSVLLINYRQRVPVAVREQQKALEKASSTWQYWCADAVETKVQKQLLSSGRARLPSDDSARSAAQRLSFRSRAWDFMLRSKSPCFDVVLEEKVGSHLWICCPESSIGRKLLLLPRH